MICGPSTQTTYAAKSILEEKITMKIGVCGIACEVCPKMVKGTCPNGEQGCVAKQEPVLPDLHVRLQQRGQALL